MSIEDVELNRLCREIRNEYKRQKEMYTRASYKPHKRYDAVSAWVSAAKLCKRLGASPVDFVTAQFKMRTGAIFANTLGGDIAERAYKQFRAQFAGRHSEEDIDASRSVGQTDILNRIATVKLLLQNKTGDTSLINEANIQELLRTPWMFDPLAVMLLAGHREEVKEEFCETAKRIYDENPYLRVAVEEMDLDASVLYDP